MVGGRRCRRGGRRRGEGRGCGTGRGEPGGAGGADGHGRRGPAHRASPGPAGRPARFHRVRVRPRPGAGQRPGEPGGLAGDRVHGPDHAAARRPRADGGRTGPGAARRPAGPHRAGRSNGRSGGRGGVASVPTMEQVAPVRYAASGGWQAVELPYRGGHLALDLLLPGGWATGAVLAGLDPVRLAAITGALAPATVDVSVPKFTIDSGLNLGQTLQRLGMPTAFGPSADFTGLFNGSREQLALTGVYEQAHIAVDEQGTTAAAAAGAVVGATAGHTSVGVTTVRFDHPFGFALRDVGTCQILFLGQVTDTA